MIWLCGFGVVYLHPTCLSIGDVSSIVALLVTMTIGGWSMLENFVYTVHLNSQLRRNFFREMFGVLRVKESRW